jgi:hypothetical protein
VTSRDFIDASDFRWDDLRCRPRRVAGQDSCFDESHSRKLVTLPARNLNSTHSTTPGQLILLKCPIPSRTGISYRLQSEPIIAHTPQVDPLLTIHLHGNELTFNPPPPPNLTSYSLVLRRRLSASQAPILASRPCRDRAQLYAQHVPGCIREPPEFEVPYPCPVCITPSCGTGSSHRATEQVAFRVAQETLIPPPSAESDNPCPTSSIHIPLRFY